GSWSTLPRYRSRMSSRSSLVGVRNQMWRPMRPGRVRAGSRTSIGTLQAQLPDLARDHEHRVEEGVEAVGEDLAHQRRLVDAVHHHQQLVERLAAPLAAAHPEAGVVAQDALVD